MLPRRLIALLKRVSRSFYLSVRVLPQPVQPQIALGYLLARAADSIADTRLIAPPARIELLRGLRSVTASPTDSAVSEGAQRSDFLVRLQLEADLPQQGGGRRGLSETAQAELTLLGEVGECLALLDELGAEDRRLIGRVLDQLAHGMIVDLSRFPTGEGAKAVPPPQVVALSTLAELDEYTYYAAGCVGEFWTDLMAAHLPELAPLAAPELRQRGVDLGKALQLTNVLRDVAADLHGGRCYWPIELLAPHGLTPARLAELAAVEGGGQPAGERPRPSTLQEARAVREVSAALHAQAIERCRSAWPYVRALPAAQVRLRLACVWPLFLALDTLALLRRVGSPLFCPATPVKVKRSDVYRLTLRSTLAALRDRGVRSRKSPTSLDRLFEQRLAAAR
ncbi:MAG: squalene/phytoene synthase family protein [Polyangia bacterium]